MSVVVFASRRAPLIRELACWVALEVMPEAWSRAAASTWSACSRAPANICSISRWAACCWPLTSSATIVRISLMSFWPSGVFAAQPVKEATWRPRRSISFSAQCPHSSTSPL
jgi:hypothetical protein